MEREGGEPPEQRSRFDSRIDEAIYRFALEGWANQSSGDRDSLTGWFARISISREELAEVLDAFREQLDGMEFPKDEEAALIGHFLLVESGPTVTVDEYDSEAEVVQAYTTLDSAYRRTIGGAS